MRCGYAEGKMRLWFTGKQAWTYCLSLVCKRICRGMGRCGLGENREAGFYGGIGQTVGRLQMVFAA